MAQDQVKPSLTVRDRAVEAVENVWNRFTTAMSFRTPAPARDDEYSVVGRTEWRSGVRSGLTRDVIGFDGENYRLGREAKLSDGPDSKSIYWHQEKFGFESDVQSRINEEASARKAPITSPQQAVSDRPIVRAEPSMSRDAKELFAPGSAWNQKPSGIKPVQGPPASPVENIWTRAAKQQADLFQPAAVTAAPKMKA